MRPRKPTSRKVPNHKKPSFMIIKLLKSTQSFLVKLLSKQAFIFKSTQSQETITSKDPENFSKVCTLTVPNKNCKADN